MNDPNEKKDEPVDKDNVTENVDTINQVMKDAKFKKAEYLGLK